MYSQDAFPLGVEPRAGFACNGGAPPPLGPEGSQDTSPRRRRGVVAGGEGGRKVAQGSNAQHNLILYE
jgi:hypothetical protein